VLLHAFKSRQSLRCVKSGDMHVIMIDQVDARLYGMSICHFSSVKTNCGLVDKTKFF